MSRRIARGVALFVLLIGTIVSPITLKPMWDGFGGKHQVVVASGVIQNKRKISYECGTTKDRKLCDEYYLNVEGVDIIVSSSTFYSSTVSSEIVLTTQESSRGGYWYEHLLICISLLGVVVIGMIFFMIFVHVFWWSFLSSSKLPLREWLKVNF